MAETMYLVFGILLLMLIIYDFFFTTLAQSGAGIITQLTAVVAHKFLQLGVKIFGRKFYSLSGLLVNLSVLVVWVALVWLGLFLVFSSDPPAIVNDDGRMANGVERLYFTGYTLSTLGIGDFTPSTSSFQILTSCFSFFGFIFFTTSMTYLVSVSSGVIHKRSLALSIRNMGANPKEMVESFMSVDTSFSHQKFSSLQQMIDRHAVNLQAFPVLHFYSTADVSSSLGLHVAKLDEAVTILLHTSKGDPFRNELIPLRRSLTELLIHIEEKYSYIYPGTIKSDAPVSDESKTGAQKDASLEHRRQILKGLLINESFGWSDIQGEE